MTTTRYFTEQVLRKRPYLTVELCRTETRILRVVTLEDGQTLHNAFIDRNYREDAL